MVALTVLLTSKGQTSKEFTINEIGWAFSPPYQFEFIDSPVTTRQISDNLTIWSKSLIFKNPENIEQTIACSIIHSNEIAETWKTMLPREIARSFDILREEKPNLDFDSASTTLTIDGVPFEKFSVVGKKNGKTKFNHIQLSSFYKGYRVRFVYKFDYQNIGEDIEKKFINSKFSK